jgi:hypothetical protein
MEFKPVEQELSPSRIEIWQSLLSLPAGSRLLGWEGSRGVVEQISRDLNDLLSLGWLRVGPRTAFLPDRRGWGAKHAPYELRAGELPFWGTCALDPADLGSEPVPFDASRVTWEPIVGRDRRIASGYDGQRRELAVGGEGFARFDSDEGEAIRRVEAVRNRLTVGVAYIPATGHLAWYGIMVSGLPEGCVPTGKGGTNLRLVVARAMLLRCMLATEGPERLPRYLRELGV